MGSRLAKLGLLGAAGLLLLGHSPYKQWYVYRAKHVVVVTDRSRPGAFATATSVAAALAAHWPQSRAVATAARTSKDVVSLLYSGQLDIAVLGPAVTREAFEGRGRFAEQGRIPLRAIAVLGDEMVVVMESYAAEKARIIAEAVAESGGANPAAAGALPASPIPFHAGALEYYASARGR